MLANPYVLIAAGLLLAASHGLVGWKAFQLGQNDIIAEEAKLDEARKEGEKAALQAAASEIAKLEVRNVTIRQKAETIVREVPVYHDCRHDPNGLQLVNEALRPPGPNPDQGKLPGSGGNDGPGVRRDDPQAD